MKHLNIIIRICSLLIFCTFAWPQKTVFFDSREGQHINFPKGTAIDFKTPPSPKSIQGGFIIGDSTAILISHTRYKTLLMQYGRGQILDSLRTLRQEAIRNLNEQKALLQAHMKTEQEAFSKLENISQIKSEISKEAFQAYEKLQRKGLYYSAFLGLIGGLLWVRDSDSDFVKGLKPAGVCFSAIYLSKQVFH